MESISKSFTILLILVQTFLKQNVIMKNKVSKCSKIRNRYNQVPHLTQDTNEKVTNPQSETKNESQEVSPFESRSYYMFKKTIFTISVIKSTKMAFNFIFTH